MQYFITIVLGIVGLANKRSKFIFACLILWIWILYAFNLNNADSYYYEKFYYRYGDLSIWTKNIEIGYQLICKFCNFIGLDYRGYLIFISLLGLGLIGYTITKLSKNYNFVITLYMFYPFMLNVVQQRNFLSMAFTIYGFQFLFSETKKSYLYYIVCIIVAASIHNFAIFYLLFIVVKILNVKKTIAFSILSLVIISAVLLFPSILWGGISYLVANDRLDLLAIHGSESNINGLIYNGIEFLVRLLIVYIIYHRSLSIEKEKYSQIKNKILQNDAKEALPYTLRDFNLFEVVLKVNIITILLFPLFNIAFEAHRAIGTVMILNYIVFAEALTRKIIFKNVSSKVLFEIMIIGYVIFLFLTKIYIPFNDTVVKPIFEFNSLFT